MCSLLGRLQIQWLETKESKIMAYPREYRYTDQHEWVRFDGDVATVGITDYAQHELGDVVFVELPKKGAKVTAGKSFGTVESVKAVSEIYAPVSGEVVDLNAELQNTPEKINSDPHGSAWLVKVRVGNQAEANKLMDAAAYEKFIADKGKEASA
jgi:glycine cleavage system H protein